MNTNPSNELTLSTGAKIGNELLPDLFHDIDVDGLNNAIENIGNVNHELEPEEKALAIDIITEWNNSVINRLETRSKQMRDVLSFFDSQSNEDTLNGQNVQEFGAALAAKTGTVSEFDALVEAQNQLEDLRMDAPESPTRSKTDTFEEDIKRQNEYETERSLYLIDKAKAERKYASALGKFKRAVLQHEDVQQLVKEARKSYNGTDKLVHMTREKGQIAKLNISISSENARNALKEILSFTSNL